jgi:phosphatidate cytidylyltransferase
VTPVSPNLARRIAFAVVAIPAVVAVAWMGGWPFAALLALAGALGARELYAFARAQGIEPLTRTGMAAAAAAPLAMGVVVLAPGAAAALIREGHLLAAFVIAVLCLVLTRRGPGGRPLTAAAVTVLGALYPGFLLSYALVLRHPHPGLLATDTRVGMSLLFYPLVLTWAGDTAAMAGGKAIGGPKVAPVVSPNKTWAGTLSGLVATVTLSLAYAAWVFPRAGLSLSVVQAIAFGAVISVAGQVGDVAESLFKREIGVKDSSNLLPGHGGVLDRLDALYFVLPVTVLALRLSGNL